MVKLITIKQVAAEAGVSIATVSRTIHLPESVAAETRIRVQQAIKKMNYHPNAQAQSLRTEQSGMVIALVPDIGNSFFAEVIRGIERIATMHKYAVLLGNTEYDVMREEAYAHLLSTRRVDGMITLLPHLPVLAGPISRRVVNACEYVSDDTVSSVYVDNIGGAKAAVDYLMVLGHRSIALINGRASPIRDDREAGYRKSLAEHGRDIDPRLILEGDFDVNSGVRAVESLLAKKTHFTAIFATSDEMALGAISALIARGLRVPQDVSVIGFDDIRLSRYFAPPLTTVAQPKGELGEEAMRLLLQLMTDPEAPVRKQVLPTQLVLRSSTAPPKF